MLDCDYKRSRIVSPSFGGMKFERTVDEFDEKTSWRNDPLTSDIISIDLKQSAICFYLILNNYDTPFKQIPLPWSILIKQRTTRHCLYIYMYIC